MTADTLTVDLGDRSYPVRIGHGWLAELGAALRERIDCDRVLVVTDDRVDRHYGGAAVESLDEAGFAVERFAIPEGEPSKTLDTCEEIYTHLLSENYSRQCALVALGGGVVGDITGFIAATYMRGVTYVQVPTTLLAMVDSSVGGKTGVNHPLGKNMIGAFYQPALVFIDVATLATLDPAEFRAGWAEVVKHCIIRDAEFFDYCEREREAIFALDPRVMSYVVRKNCEIKAAVVAADEREAGLRAILNFGHTVGHAIESLTDYSRYKHGEAVAIGMVAAGRLAVRMGRFDQASQERIERLLEQSDLPVRIPSQLASADVVERLKKDKKVKQGQVRFVLPEKIGRVTIESGISSDLVYEVVDEMRDG